MIASNTPVGIGSIHSLTALSIAYEDPSSRCSRYPLTLSRFQAFCHPFPTTMGSICLFSTILCHPNSWRLTPVSMKISAGADESFYRLLYRIPPDKLYVHFFALSKHRRDKAWTSSESSLLKSFPNPTRWIRMLVASWNGKALPYPVPRILPTHVADNGFRAWIRHICSKQKTILERLSFCLHPTRTELEEGHKQQVDKQFGVKKKQETHEIHPV